MKSLKKIFEGFGLISPAIILLFSCAAYITNPESDCRKQERQEQSARHEKIDVMKEVLMQQL